MRVRATSDLHLADRTAGYVFAALDAVLDGFRDGALVLVGDIFDQPELVSMPLFNRLRDRLRAHGEVYVIPGNHDQYDRPRHCLEALHGGGVVVIDRPQWTRLGLMVPYHEPSEWREAVEAVGDNPQPGVIPSITWAHQGFKGAYMNRMRRDPSGLPVANLPTRVLITGHYHMPQNLGYVIYCGSPYQTDFSEEGQVKSFLHWEDPTVDPLPVRVPYPDIGAPRHWTVEWSPGEPEPALPAGWREGDIVRLKTTATREAMKQHGRMLAKTGLDGAAIVARPETLEASRGVVEEGDNPQTAAESWVDFELVSRPEHPTRGNMHDYAEEIGLWHE